MVEEGPLLSADPLFSIHPGGCIISYNVVFLHHEQQSPTYYSVFYASGRILLYW